MGVKFSVLPELVFNQGKTRKPIAALLVLCACRPQDPPSKGDAVVPKRLARPQGAAQDQDPATEGDAVDLALEGSRLSPQDADRLEKQIDEAPDDLAARTMLLGYYFQADKSPEVRRARQRHVLWIIEHRPEAKIAGTPYASLDPILDGDAYYQGEALWQEKVKEHPGNTAILGNASDYLIVHAMPLAEDFLKRAEALEPENPEWSARLAHLYDLQANGKPEQERKQAAAKAEAKRKEAGVKELVRLEKQTAHADPLARFFALGKLAKAALQADEKEKARAYATELLKAAREHEDNWNFGNAIHDGHAVLGRLALKEGDLKAAKEHLLEAGKTPGSPQLASFGPDMTLARELLGKGETETVLQYLELCGKFWETGREKLALWTASLRRGETPDLK